MAKEDIIVTARLVDKLSGGIKTVRNTINEFGQITKIVTKQHERMADGTKKLIGQTKRLNRVTQSARIAQGGFFDVMKMGLPHWSQYNKMGGQFKTTGGKVANSARQMVHGMRGFRMEMLSVMFGGQMLQKSMFGLLKPALQAVGVFEMWGAMMTILFLPIAMWLLENFFLPLMDIFMGLPEPVKVVIGAFVLFVGVIGAILAVGGALVLFIGGLVIAWGTLNAIFVASPLGWVVLAIMAIVIIIVALVAITIYMWYNWNNVLTWIKEHPFWAFIIAIFFPIIAVIFALIAVIKYMWPIWSAIWDKVIEKLKPIAEFFKKWVIDPIKTAWDWLMEHIGGWVGKIIGKLGGLRDKIVGWLGGGEGAGATPRQSGGYVPHTGLYKLHAGENVSQAGSSFSPNITVYASSNVDIDMLKSQLSSTWNDELGRLSRR